MSSYINVPREWLGSNKWGDPTTIWVGGAQLNLQGIKCLLYKWKKLLTFVSILSTLPPLFVRCNEASQWCLLQKKKSDLWLCVSTFRHLFTYYRRLCCLLIIFLFLFLQELDHWRLKNSRIHKQIGRVVLLQ